MNSIPKTNVVVICFNALSYTQTTLQSLFASTSSPYLLTIIDNGSDMDTQLYLKGLKARGSCVEITIIRNDENMGVGYAYNQGFDVSLSKKTEYTCFCNNDLFFSDDWLFNLETYLDSHQNVALVNPLRPSTSTMYSPSLSTLAKLHKIEETNDWQRELSDFTERPVGEFNNFCAHITQLNRLFYKSDDEILKFPDSLSTCVCLARNEHLAELNNFANPIFSGYGGEDIDTCWRVMSHGYDCAIYRRVYVHHFRGKSLKPNGLNRRTQLEKSNKLLYSIWKDSIDDFINNEITSGVDVHSKLNSVTNNEYWLLSQLNMDVNILEGIKND